MTASLLRLWHLATSDGQLRLGAIAFDACERFCEAVSLARRCSRVVQLTTDVLTASAHAAVAWEAAVSACYESAAAVALGDLRWSVANESHRMRRL